MYKLNDKFRGDDVQSGLYDLIEIWADFYAIKIIDINSPCLSPNLQTKITPARSLLLIKHITTLQEWRVELGL